MEVVKPHYRSYTKEEMNRYIFKLSQELMCNGLSCDQIASNSEYALFVKLFVEKEIYNKEISDTLKGITHRFVHISITEKTKDVLYPVMHKYKGHNLQGTYIFVKSKTGITESITYDYIECVASNIILLN